MDKKVKKAFVVNQHIEFIGIPKDDPDHEAMITYIRPDGRIHVSNANMPYLGTINKIYTQQQLEKIVE